MKTRYQIELGKGIIQGEEAAIIVQAINVAHRNNHPKTLRLKPSKHQLIKVEEDKKGINYEEIIPRALNILRANQHKCSTRKKMVNLVASYINQARRI